MPAAYTTMPSVQLLDFEDICLLIRHGRLIYGSCSSSQRFACGFLQTPPRGGSPCRPANGSRCWAHRGLTPPSRCALPGTHKKTPLLGASVANIFFVALDLALDFSVKCHRLTQSVHAVRCDGWIDVRARTSRLLTTWEQCIMRIASPLPWRPTPLLSFPAARTVDPAHMPAKRSPLATEGVVREWRGWADR